MKRTASEIRPGDYVRLQNGHVVSVQRTQELSLGVVEARVLTYPESQIVVFEGLVEVYTPEEQAERLGWRHDPTGMPGGSCNPARLSV